MKTLYKPQQTHVERLIRVLDQNNSAADLSRCGLGKTVCAAEIARAQKRPFLVIAPLSTIPTWRAELADRGVAVLDVLNYEKLRTGKTPWAKKDRQFWKWEAPADTIICFDEAQRLKSWNSLTSKIAIAAKPFTTLLLSGSLAENPTHMRASGFLLGLHALRNFWAWAKARGCEPGMFGGLEFTGGLDALNRIHHELLPACGSQMSLAEMADFLPDNQVLFEEVDFGDAGKIQKLYAEMEAELLQLAETASHDSKGAEILTAQLRARQQAELLKVPLLAERAQDLAAEGNSVIVFLCFTESLRSLSERLGTIPVISGQHGNREAVIQDFQNDLFPILGVNVAAGGVGISLHGKRPRTTLLSPSFNPIEIMQALWRAPRVGGSAVIQHVLTAAGTIEEDVSRSLKKKMKNIDVINAGCALRTVIPVPAIAAVPTYDASNSTCPSISGQPYPSIPHISDRLRAESSSLSTPKSVGVVGAKPCSVRESLSKVAATISETEVRGPNDGASHIAEPSSFHRKPSESHDDRAPQGGHIQSTSCPQTDNITSEKRCNISDKNVAILPRITESRGAVTTEKNMATAGPCIPDEPAHAEFSPSSLSMFEKCPGWRNRNETTPQAEAGTRIHKALEKDDIAGLTDDQERAVAQTCQDFMDSLIAERGIPHQDFREVRLYIDLGGGLTTFGTTDRLLVWGKHGILVDYKSGHLAVADAEENAQGWSYVVGAFQRPDLALETCDIYFLIPNRDEISSAAYSRGQVPNMQLRLNTIVRRAMVADEAQFAPAPALCEYCSRQESCPALAKKALKIGAQLGLPVPANAIVDISRPEDIPHLLRLAPLMESWAAGIRKAALKLNLEEGLDIAGFRRIERSNPRSVNSVLGAWKVIRDKGVTLEDFLAACSTVSIPQLEDLVASLAPRGDKGKAVKALETSLRGADVLNEGGKSWYLKEKRK